MYIEQFHWSELLIVFQKDQIFVDNFMSHFILKHMMSSCNSPFEYIDGWVS